MKRLTQRVVKTVDNKFQFTDDMLRLDTQFYGNVEKISDTLSKCRVRIFYKGMNRNRTYISDEFANQLIASLPYAPVKGIYENDMEDFSDHGEDNTDGRIYAIVASNPNFAWEFHLDKDGVQREYACADVILFTGLYPEASEIVGKGQSMEIFRDNLDFEWKICDEDGLPYVYFKKGCLLGLQILGDEHEPCFEGAAFYKLYNEQKALFDMLLNKMKEEKRMEKEMFQLSNTEKEGLMFSALNPNFTEQGEWATDYIVLNVYDEYTLAYNKVAGQYERICYTQSEDEITIGEKTAVTIIDFTENEKQAFDAIKALGEFTQTVEKYNSMQAQIETLEQEKTAFATEKSELEGKITTANEALEATKSTFETEKSELTAKIADFENQINELKNEVANLKAENFRLIEDSKDIMNEKNSLADFKKSIELGQKEELLANFSNNLNESQIAGLKEKIDSYSVEDFKKEICVIAYDNNRTIFEKQDSNGLIFKGGDPECSHSETGVERILNKYKKGGNK